MKSQICMMCHFSDSVLQDLERVERFLMRHDYPRTGVRINLQQPMFDFGQAPRCKFGMTCEKTRNAQTKMHLKSTEVSELIYQYISTTDCSDIHELLRLLQGRFPAAYKQVERLYSTKERK